MNSLIQILRCLLHCYQIIIRTISIRGCHSIFHPYQWSFPPSNCSPLLKINLPSIILLTKISHCLSISKFSRARPTTETCLFRSNNQFSYTISRLLSLALCFLQNCLSVVEKRIPHINMVALYKYREIAKQIFFNLANHSNDYLVIEHGCFASIMH